MRRWILIFLMTVLPIQYSWAAAAQYCGHEVQSNVSHVGHHEHKHQDSEKPDSTASDARGDLDCNACHFAHGSSIPAGFGVPAVNQPYEYLDYRKPYYLSRIPSGLERPQIPAAAFAVRIGSGPATLSP